METSSRDLSLIRKCHRSIYVLALAACLCGCSMGQGNTFAVPEVTEPVQEETQITPAAEDMGQGKAEAIAENEASVEESGAGEDEEDSISIVMVGDILLHDGINKTCRLEDWTYDYLGLFENVRDEIGAADIAIVNQEVIIGGRELKVTGYPSFNAPYEIADGLASTGFDVVCHATNHVYDRGETGLVNCLRNWEENYPDITIVGVSDSQHEEEIPIIEDKGIRVAILNYTYGTNGVNISGGDRFSVNRLKKERVISDLKRAEEEADFTIVCPHWGIEYDLAPSDEQREWAEVFMENGADLVIGTHPHVIQPVEWMEDEVNGHRMLVYYSLGNYVNWTSGEGRNIGYRLVGGMARVRVGHDEGGHVSITGNDIEALVTHLSKKRDELTVYRLIDYNDRLSESNEILKQDPDFSVDYCRDLCDKIWPGMWR